MKKRMLVVGLIALLMVGGLVMVGCGSGCTSSKGSCDYGPATSGTSYDWCGESKCNSGAGGTACNC